MCIEFKKRGGGIFIIDHCQRNWGKGFFSLPPLHLYDKNQMVAGNIIKRRIRVKDGDKLIDLEVISCLERKNGANWGNLFFWF